MLMWADFSIDWNLDTYKTLQDSFHLAHAKPIYQEKKISTSWLSTRKLKPQHTWSARHRSSAPGIYISREADAARKRSPDTAARQRIADRWSRSIRPHSLTRPCTRKRGRATAARRRKKNRSALQPGLAIVTHVGRARNRMPRKASSQTSRISLIAALSIGCARTHTDRSKPWSHSVQRPKSKPSGL